MRSQPIRASYLLHRIADTRARLATTPNLANEDLTELVLEVATEARRGISFARLERRLLAAAAIDVSSLAAAVRLFSGLGPGAFDLTYPNGARLDVNARLLSLEDLVASLETPEKLDQWEVVLRLGTLGDCGVDVLLMGLTSRVTEVETLRAMVSAKLDMVDDARLLTLLAQYRAETSPERSNRIELGPPICASDFLTNVAASELRARIAEYVTWVRPQSERRQALAGQSLFPADYVGVARILSWTPTSVADDDLSPAESTVARSTARLSVWWKGDKAPLADAFGISRDGILLAGRAFQEAARHRDELRRGEAALDELQQLVRIMDRMQASDSPIARGLRAYKLGLEVATPHIEVKASRAEIYLQRHICRFLVEREIWAIGTKFGRSEADIRAEDDLDVFVIEVKRLRRAPSEAELIANVSQLLQYMDQAPMHRCGVLAIYNFSDVPIAATQAFLRGRVLILPINLGPNRPSEARTSIVIEEPKTEDEWFRMLHIKPVRRDVPKQTRMRTTRKKRR